LTATARCRPEWPCGRCGTAPGRRSDLRKLEPYCGYEQYDFKAIIPPFTEKPADAVIGDCWHRFYVRMLEVLESIKLASATSA
jgi:NADH-quinone oxidoreductase subunit D